MQDIFLGIIAVGVTVMTVMQVAALLKVMKLVQRLDTLVEQVSAEVRPLMADLRSVAADASKATGIVLGQVERVERMVSDVMTKVEDGIAAFEASVVAPLRDLLSLIGGLGATFAGFRRTSGASGGTPRRDEPAVPDTGDDDDGLFAG